MMQFLKSILKFTVGLLVIYFFRVLLILISNLMDPSIVIGNRAYKLNTGCSLINRSDDGAYAVIGSANLWNPLKKKELISFYNDFPISMRDDYLRQPGSYFDTNLGKAYIGKDRDPWGIIRDTKNYKMIAFNDYFIVAKDIYTVNYCISSTQ